MCKEAWMTADSLFDARMLEQRYDELLPLQTRRASIALTVGLHHRAKRRQPLPHLLHPA